MGCSCFFQSLKSSVNSGERYKYSEGDREKGEGRRKKRREKEEKKGEGRIREKNDCRAEEGALTGS